LALGDWRGRSAITPRRSLKEARGSDPRLPGLTARHADLSHMWWTCPGFVEGLGLGIRVSCLTTFCPPVWWHSFVRPPAEPFFHPGPHENAAVARSGGQGRPHFGAARRACPCMRLSKSSAYLTHSPLPSFQF